MLAPVRTIPPAAPVVTLEAAKQHLRADFDDDDVIIQALIDAAVDHLDGYGGILGRALINQTWRQDFGGFSCKPLRLPLVPVLSDPTVAYFDQNNVQQPLASSHWQMLTDSGGPYVALKPDQSWPSSYSRADAVSVTFVAGYGASTDDVPPALKVAVLTHVKMHYDPASRETVQPLFDVLVRPYVRFQL